MECGNIVTIFFKCPSAEKPNHGQHWLLRAHRNRPSSCTAKKGDELAPSQGPAVNSGRGIVSRQMSRLEGVGLRTADVRFGSLADICSAIRRLRSHVPRVT